MKNTINFGQKIGNLVVYDEQFTCAMKIYSIFKRLGGPPLLVAQMQQGKTGTAIIVINQFINNCELENKKFEIIYLTNISDNVLKNQNDERVLEAGISSKVKILHHADLSRFVPCMDVDVRLIIIDECQIALGKNRPLHRFLKHLGIKYGESIDTWRNKKNYVLSISATPYAQIIQSKLINNSFEAVVLPMNNDYYSLQHLYEAGRLRQSEQVVRKGQITTFFIDRMNEFMASCKVNGGNGDMIVRAKGKAPDILKRYIEQNYPGVDVRIFEAYPTNNIASLDGVLGKNLPHPFVAIIRGSLRAGKTLTTTKYIHMWIEPPSSKTDTMCQVVGRCVGYEMVGEKNRRFEDNFPIYCNIKEINIAIKFFNQLDCIPEGIRNKSNAAIMKYKMIFADRYEDIPVTSINIGEGINHISAHESIDLARNIINESKPSGKSTIILIDGAHPKWRNSWNELLVKYPECQGKYVYFVEIPTGSVVIETLTPNHLKPDCIFVDAAVKE